MSKIKAGSTAFNLIMRYARKRLAAPNAEGIMEVMSNKQAMDFVKDLVNEFNRFGVPESAITKVDDVGKFANQIVDIKQQRLMQEFKKQMTPKKSADIIELQTGKKIDQSKGIMGGRQVDQTDDEATKALQDKLAKDKGYQKYRGETEEQIRERFKKQNKEAIERFKKNMDDLEDKATGAALKSGIMKATGAKPIEARADISKYIKDGKPDDDKLNALVDRDMILKEEADSLATKGENYERFQQISEERKNIREIIEDVRKMFPEDMAQGGRAGFKIGSIDKARRAFLKAAAGIGGGIAALKTGLLNIGKGTTKQVAKEVITTPNAPGKPEWFDALVTRVINEGEDVTKGFATKERELVHTKQINDFAEVTVYRDLDTNTTTVNYGAKLRKDPTKPYERGNISRAVNDPDQIDLVVKGSEDIEPTVLQNEKGFVRRRGTKSSAEFEAYESEPRVVNYDGDMEFDGTNVVNNVDDLMEDISPLKEYATGKKLTVKEAAKASEKRDKYQKFLEDPVEQANYLENKYGPGPYLFSK